MQRGEAVPHVRRLVDPRRVDSALLTAPHEQHADRRGGAADAQPRRRAAADNSLRRVHYLLTVRALRLGVTDVVHKPHQWSMYAVDAAGGIG